MGCPHPLRSLLRASILATMLTAAFSSSAAAFEARIIQGSPVAITDHPYQVRVITDMADGAFVCGGSIRDATHIVTAAHCVVDEASFYPRIVSPSAVQVGFSSADQLALTPVQVQRVSVAPGYLREGTPASDAAVLTLASPIDLADDPEAEPIPFASDTELEAAFAGSLPAFATGWGATSEGGSSSRFLRGVDLALRSHSVCQAEYGQDYDGSVMICAGGTGSAPSGNKDTCQGDSGGPLAIDTNADPNVEAWELVGITSFGTGCGRRDTPGSYAWVQSNILRPFLEAAVPAAPPGLPATSPTITGTLRVGSSVTCNAPALAGATPTRFIWFVVEGNNFTEVENTDRPTLTLPDSTLGSFIVCDVRYENAGGFTYSEAPADARIGPVQGALPPSGISPGGTMTPTPLVARDTTRPRARVASVRCRRGRCTMKVRASDAGGLVRGLSAKLTYKVRRCRTAAGRKRCRSVTRTRRLRPARSRGGFTIVKRLAPGRYKLSVVARDRSGNRSRTARRTFRVSRAR